MTALVLQQPWDRQPKVPTAFNEHWSRGSYVVRALFNFGLGAAPTNDRVGGWTATGQPVMKGAGSNYGVTWGGNSHFSKALTLSGDGSGTQTQRNFIEVVVFTVLSNSAQECICSEGTAYNDGGPKYLLQNNSGTMRMYRVGLGYTDAETAVVGKQYVAIRTYREFAAASYPYKLYFQGRLIATATGYAQFDATNWLGAGFPGFSTNNIMHAYYFERGPQVLWTDERIAELSRNPWRLFRPMVRSIPSMGVAGGGGGGWKPYWASQRSHVIGAGVI